MGKIMFNTTKSKSVKIRIDGTGSVIAMYVQIYQNEEQVLQSKTFSTTTRAEKWAHKVLNQCR